MTRAHARQPDPASGRALRRKARHHHAMKARHDHGDPAFGLRGFGGPGFERGGRGRRRMRRGDVRNAILVLLDEQPNNGYGLMQEIESRSDGVWRPSPGSMYPALAQLEDEGLVAADDTGTGTGKQFALTDAGKAHVAENREQLGEPWGGLGEQVGEGRLELRRLIGQLAAAAVQVSQVGSDAQIAKAREVLVDARKALYRLLAEDETTDSEPS
jgi:DNA-binding PadR family transcriptional regulator